MVVIGTLSWNVNVEGAAEAKQQVQNMNTGMEETAEQATESAENLDELAATYTSIEHLMRDTTEATEEQESSLTKTILAYAGLADVLGMTTDEEEEQETQSSFLASGLFFLGSMVGRLLIQYTQLGGVVRVVTKLFGALAAVVKWLAGLSLGAWVAKVVGGIKGLVSWLAAGSAGALALAGAIGFVIGMFGVWILKITGVLDWFQKLGATLSTSLPNWARDGLLAVISIFAGGLAVLGGLVIGFIEGGFSGAWKRAAQIVEIFWGAFERTFGRIANFGKSVVNDAVLWWKNWKSKSLTFINTFIDEALMALSSFSESMSRHITEGIRGVFNTAIPSELGIPELDIGGQTIDAGKLGSVSVPEYTLGGQTLNLPQLEEGGIVEDTGLAEVHEGEAYIPRDVRQTMDGDGDGQETKNVTINVGGIEMGDQSLDLSRMSTTELRNLAQQIAEILGTEVDTIV